MPAAPVFRPRPDPIQALFGRSHAVIGVIHCLPLPGAPEYEGRPMADIVQHAVDEGRRYVEGGVDGLIVENHGDIPFAKPDQLGPETAACMAVIAAAVAAACPVPIGDQRAGQRRAGRARGRQGLRRRLHPRQPMGQRLCRQRGLHRGPGRRPPPATAPSLRATDIRLFADVHVKHGAHAITADRTLAELARDVEFFGADAAIATGQRTGDSASLDELQAIAAGTSLPVLVGSGVTPDNVGDMFSVARARDRRELAQARRRVVERGRSGPAAHLHGRGRPRPAPEMSAPSETVPEWSREDRQC